MNRGEDGMDPPRLAEHRAEGQGKAQTQQPDTSLEKIGVWH